MNDTQDVISAFLDDEPFDANALKTALGDPAGRELLIDLIALRHLTRMERAHEPEHTGRLRWSTWSRTLVAAAAVVVALVGGYAAGARRSETTSAPPATRVVESPETWQDVHVGRMP